MLSESWLNGFLCMGPVKVAKVCEAADVTDRQLRAFVKKRPRYIIERGVLKYAKR